ncbi:unnamed protein product [Auanema sp. JU1783]|nr:unnamed protein product [Auanema sp. JU1783]
MTTQSKESQSPKKEGNEEFPVAPALPLCDRVKELKLDEYDEEDKEFYEDLLSKPISYYFDKKDVPDAICRKFIPDISRRFMECEKRIQTIEDLLTSIPNKESGLNEMRFETLVELLDKACQGFEIWEEHVTKKIPYGHRVVLEASLCNLISSKFEIITQICDDLSKMGEDRDSWLNKAEWLRYEIRSCDMIFYELHVKFLQSYMGISW